MKIIIMSFLLFGVSGFSADGSGVKEKFEALNKMRETLASSLDGKKEPITELDFKNVCMPVGMEFKKWVQSQGYIGRQVSEKNRNPNHAPSDYELKILKKFKEDPNLTFFYEKGNFQKNSGTFMFGRIQVTNSCLHCHGEMNSRPEFIQKKYLEDKAFNYKAGDFRGMYSVFVPDQKSK